MVDVKQPLFKREDDKGHDDGSSSYGTLSSENTLDTATENLLDVDVEMNGWCRNMVVDWDVVVLIVVHLCLRLHCQFCDSCGWTLERSER